MSNSCRRLRGIRLLALTLAFASASLPLAAEYARTTGNLYGRIVDEQEGVLRGVAVTISGPAVSQTYSSDSRGEFRALNLAPGAYTVTFAMAGFASVVRENVEINLGRDTELTVTMKLSAAAEAVTVSGGTPLLETRRVTTGANISQEELKSIPTPRDPWALLQSVPGVQLDSINVGGSESTFQATFSAKGSALGTFAVDGVSFTDSHGAGASNALYDFDSFQEIQVITGGSDPSIQGSGAHLNMVTKRGTNDVRGSGRMYVVDHRWGSENLPEEAARQQLSAGTRIESIEDYGLEMGGPIRKDRVWLWGAYGRYETQLRPFGENIVFTSALENFNARLNGQPLSSNSVELWYQRSDIPRFGRGSGATRPQETTWDQKTPQNSWKIEDSQVFTSNLFATVQYSGQNGNFVLVPEGGLSTQTFLDADSVWHNTYEYISARFPQRQLKADASFFFNTGKLGHELKAGFSYIHAISSSVSVWPGDGSNGLAAKTYGDLVDCPVPCAVVTRDGTFSADSHLFAAFLSDTVMLDRLTVAAGLRWDRQYGTNRPANVGENPSFPQILPALSYSGQAKQFTWTNLQPRIGLTYSLGAKRKTIAKASYARFAEALGIGVVSITNPAAGPAYAFYGWHDGSCGTPADNLVQPCEVDLNDLKNARNYDPANPGSVGTPLNGVDPNLKAPTVDEIIIGADHELLPAFALGVSYTYRRFKGQLFSALYDAQTGTVLSRGDYEQYDTLNGTLPDGSPYSEPVYQIKQSVLDRLGAVPPGFFTFNRPDFSTTYSGLELTLTKRLEDRWMARGSLVWNDNRQHVGANGCIDPTNVLSQSRIPPANAQSCRDGDFVAIQSGNKGGVFLNSRWQANLLALYQLPLGLSVAASFFARQGYPINWFVRSFGPTDDLPRDVVVAPAGSQRYESVYELDLRLEKSVAIARGSTLTLSADLFNATNQNTVLQRQNQLGLESTNSIFEIQSPRIWRFGVRYSF